jgi:hypothetical protein
MSDSTEPVETIVEQPKPFDRELKILSPPKNAGPVRKFDSRDSWFTSN